MVQVDALRPGMQLAQNVYDTGGQVLLSAETILRDVYIELQPITAVVNSMADEMIQNQGVAIALR